MWFLEEFFLNMVLTNRYLLLEVPNFWNKELRSFPEGFTYLWHLVITWSMKLDCSFDSLHRRICAGDVSTFKTPNPLQRAPTSLSFPFWPNSISPVYSFIDAFHVPKPSPLNRAQSGPHVPQRPCIVCESDRIIPPTPSCNSRSHTHSFALIHNNHTLLDVVRLG